MAWNLVCRVGNRSSQEQKTSSVELGLLMASAVDVLDVRITIFVPQSGTRVCRSSRIEQLDQPSS